MKSFSKTILGVFLIILGIGSFSFSVNSPIYILFGIGLIGAGIYLMPFFKKKTVIIVSDDDRDGYDGPIAGESYYGVRDRNGNFIDVENGNFTEGLDGRFRDDNGNVVEKDSDNKYNLL